MKVIIAGCRRYHNYLMIKDRCDYYLQNQEDIEIVSGCATGVDQLAVRYSLETYNKEATKFPANFKELSYAAGPIRNKEMAEYADALIAFWDGKSPGTKNMIKTAKKLGLKVRIVRI